MTPLKTTMILAALMIPAQAMASNPSTDSAAYISLKGFGDPASDLTYNQNGTSVILTPAQAKSLKANGIIKDLSLLEPDPTTDIWKNYSTVADGAKDAALPVHSGDAVKFAGVIASTSGHFKFNVETQISGKAAEMFTVFLATDMHSFLLRKELLRRLGYQIPAMNISHV